MINAIECARYRCGVLLLLVSAMGVAIPTTANAGINCNPRSIVGRAVGGELLNQALGGFSQILGAAGGVQNGISPTPSDAMRDCIIPAINPPPRDNTPYDSSPIQSAPPRAPSFGWGDPHLVTHDGVGYDFQGAGDYVYIEGGGLTVQARQFRLSPNAIPSRIKAFAVRTDEVTVVINDPIDPALKFSADGIDDVLTVNGVDLPISIGGWIDLDDRGSFVQRFRKHTYLRIVGKIDLLVSSSGNVFELILDESMRGQVSGLLGNFDGIPNNDFQTAAGSLIDINDNTVLYGEYLNSWLRQGSASLFNSEFDPAVDGAISTSLIPSVSTSTLELREELAERCINAGVPQGFLLHGCIYDLLFDGDEELLQNAAQLNGRATGIVSSASLSTDLSEEITLTNDAIVAPLQPVPAAGQLSNINEIDRYTTFLAGVNQRMIQWDSPCSSAQPFSLLVEREEGVASAYAAACDAPLVLPQGQVSFAVFSQGGDTGDYAFRLIESATTELGQIALETVLDGTLAATEQLRATLPVTESRKVFIESNQTENCAREWQVLDASNTVIKRRSVCNDLGLITTDSTTPYRIRILPGAGAEYAFTVLNVGDSPIIEAGLNREFSFSIDTPGQSASAQFTVLEGERIYVDRVGGVDSGTLTVTDPLNNDVVTTSAFEADTQFVAAQGGDYTLTLQADDFTGTVPISIVSIADDTEISVNRGDTFTLALSTLGQRAIATFDAVAGESYTVVVKARNTVSGLSSAPKIQPPDGALSLTVFDSRTFTLESSGSVQIILDSTQQDNFIGSVEIELQ